VWDDYGPGGHAWPYWQRGLRQALPAMLETFAAPRAAPPRRVSFTAVEPAYEVFGWRVRLARPALEFSRLVGATRRGFTLEGSGAGTVTTPRLGRPRARYRVRVGDAARRTLRADRRGRLSIAVPLGRASTGQQHRPGTVTRVHRTRVRIARSHAFHRSATGR
jgi:hypothetical protein